MPLKLPPHLAFQRADHRAEFERARGAFKSALKSMPFDEAAATLLELGTALDGAVSRLKRDLLASALCWNEDHHALTGWIHQQHRKLAEHAARLLEECAVPDLRIAAALLQHEAEAMKWIGARERPDLGGINALVARAMDAGLADAEVNCSVDGRGHRTTLEAMYLRVLLLDRLGTGALARQQVEVLDAWLRDACVGLHLAEARVEGPSFAVDLAGDSGLRAAEGATGDRVRWIDLAPLEARRRAIVCELQAGRIVPAYGCAAEFRIEEHVAVLLHLRQALAMPASVSSRRETRESTPGTRVETWAGLAEILQRAKGAPGVETGQWRALAPGQPGAANDGGELDPQRRYLWLCDTSPGGCGFEALEQDAAGIEIGDLLGWKRGGDICVGRVMRRVPGKTAGQVFLGVRLLTECAQPLSLKRVDASEADGSEASYLFVPGDDASGRRDAFLVPESVFSQERAYRARAGEESFTLRLNRVRARGRGWILAGFEIVPPRVAAPAMPAASGGLAFHLMPALPATQEAAAEDALDPWSREVPLRLLD